MIKIAQNYKLSSDYSLLYELAKTQDIICINNESTKQNTLCYINAEERLHIDSETHEKQKYFLHTSDDGSDFLDIYATNKVDFIRLCEERKIVFLIPQP